jgi:hypothetical protein
MIRFKLVSHTKVIKLLNGLSNSKATGLDKIFGKILKTAARTTALSLTHIFNQAIITSCFPYEWKAARLLPLHKKGPRDLPENYRPVSILLAISKVMERILYDQIYEYLNDITRFFPNTNLVSANLTELLRLFWIARIVGTLIWTTKCLIWLYYWI